MNHTIISTNSLLAQQLEELVQSGVVTLKISPVNAFPSARIVVPVYDSNGTQSLDPKKKAEQQWPTGTMF